MLRRNLPWVLCGRRLRQRGLTPFDCCKLDGSPEGTGSTSVTAAFFQTITGVFVALARSITFRAACSKAASASLVKGWSFFLFTGQLRLSLDQAKQPLLFHSQFLALFRSNQLGRQSRRVVQPAAIQDGEVHLKQVSQACRISSANVGGRDVMSTLLNAICHTSDCHVGIRQPQVEEQCLISAGHHDGKHLGRFKGVRPLRSSQNPPRVPYRSGLSQRGLPPWVGSSACGPFALAAARARQHLEVAWAQQFVDPLPHLGVHLDVHLS